MKVLTNGVLPKSRWEGYEGVCNECGCKVRIENEDDHRVGTFFFNTLPNVRCPTYGCEVEIRIYKPASIKIYKPASLNV